MCDFVSQATLKCKLRKVLGATATTTLANLAGRTSVALRRAIRKARRDAGTGPQLQATVLSVPRAHVFFGYYDVSPFGREENVVLACVLPKVQGSRRRSATLRVGFFDLREQKPEFHELGVTNAWCWQQGCRLQWYPGSGTDAVIYNSVVEGQYGAIIAEVPSGRPLATLSDPIYSVSSDGRWALSLNFSRLHRLRSGYGYGLLPDQSRGNQAPSEDGIWLIDIWSGERELVHSVRDIAAFGQCVPVPDREHYVNHLLFSPNGERYMFFHASKTVDGARATRLMTSDTRGDRLRVHEADGHVSHYVWMDDERLLCSFVTEAGGAEFRLVEARTGRSMPVGQSSLVEDGHPSVFLDGEALLVDTYPDKYHDARLLVYRVDKDLADVLHVEFIPPSFTGEFRCDLHPRISSSCEQICIDAVVGRRRVIKVLKTEWGRQST